VVTLMGAKQGTPVPSAMASAIFRVLPVGEKKRDCTEPTGLAVITNLHLISSERRQNSVSTLSEATAVAGTGLRARRSSGR
jgi:hypothetical protein